MNRLLIQFSLAAAALLAVGNLAMAHPTPQPETNYDEAYRGQFHFSPPVGWMNDVNGLWYWDGLYHMTYQYYPYGLTPGPMEWGYATSPDLLHWTNLVPALVPNVNVPGDCWSGSTVVDTENTSGLSSGNTPAFVAIYTATGKGTCLAYSNDLGKTWRPYAGNPVNIGGPNGDTRDPHVFWYAPTRRWVCAYYEHGISLYTSADLEHWTKTCHLDFGFECPDMYEIPVDGSAENSKWVLQDGSGHYLLGQFDGSTFTPDAGGPYAMDVGPDFYAAQTFYRRTFPDSRVIQVAWNSKPGNQAPNTQPWTHNATFPCELKLRTFPEGIRLTRTPIAEIAKLYVHSRRYGSRVLHPGENWLAGETSEACDIDIDFDLSHATAKTISFQIADLSFQYDIVGKALLGHPLAPIDNHIKIRILRDRGELAVFGNDGELSYSRQYKFTPGDTRLAITADGDLAVAGGEFHEIKRTWPGRAGEQPAVVDDAAPVVTYTGTWNTDNNPFYFDSTSHYGNTTGGSLETTFVGTRIDWWGLVNSDLGVANVYVDGTLAASVDCYSPIRSRKLLYSASGLAAGSHRIRLVVTGRKNAHSTGTSIVHDCFLVYGGHKH